MEQILRGFAFVKARLVEQGGESGLQIPLLDWGEGIKPIGTPRTRKFLSVLRIFAVVDFSFERGFQEAS
uniref:Uncharacterized protein n=1 Tax=Oryza sativa subsp. japonica TaxID=39947 RepID=Q2R0U1_ORYSJ|nr:hypothetical protein LOC_Os11g41420 [Oryza sativa Japonica Group]